MKKNVIRILCVAAASCAILSESRAAQTGEECIYDDIAHTYSCSCASNNLNDRKCGSCTCVNGKAEYGTCVLCQGCVSPTPCGTYPNCTGNKKCTACDTAGEWSPVSGSPGYQTRQEGGLCIASCTTDGTCRNRTTKYRCAAGYYGSSTDGISGCTQCPEANGIYTDSANTIKAHGTADAGSEAVELCKLLSGTYHDICGSFVTAAACYF